MDVEGGIARFLVTSGTDDTNADDGVLTLREAIHLAEGTKGSDRITFSSDLYYIDTSAVIEINSGKVTIDGDGVSDLLFHAGSSNHLNIGAAATVTVVNVDFINGYGFSSKTPTTGVNGAQGAQGLHVIGNDGLEGRDGYDGADGGDATGGEGG